MTAALAIHLIEQFAAQAPFAIWVTDSRGVSIFANKKLHEMLDIVDHPSGALGINLFEDPSVQTLHLTEAAQRAKRGEVVDLIIRVPEPDKIASRVPVRRKEPLTLKVSCYSLRSSAQKVEHYVIALRDVTESYEQKEKLRQHLRDLTIFNKSRDARLARLSELQAEASRLEAEIASRGGKPTTGA